MYVISAVSPAIGGGRLWRPTLKKQQQYAVNPIPSVQTVYNKYDDKSNTNRADETRYRRLNTVSMVHGIKYTNAGYLYVHGCKERIRLGVGYGKFESERVYG